MPHSQLKLLIRLRWMLTTRTLSRAGCATQIIYWIATSGVSVVFFLGVQEVVAGQGDAEGAIRVILTVYLAMATLLPLLSFHQGSAYDPTALFHYPIRPVTVFWGSVLARFLSLGLLIPAAMALGIISALGGELGDWMVRSAIAVAVLFLPILISQILLLELHTLLSRRRTRDMLTLVSTFVVIGLYLGLRLVLTNARIDDLSEVARQFPEPLWWLLPSTWASGLLLRGLEAGVADWVGAGALCLGLLLLSRWGGASSRRSFFAEIQTAPSTGPTRAKRDGVWILAGFSNPVREIAQRELRHFWRDPVLKGLVLRQLGLVAIPIVLQISGNKSQIGGSFLVHLTTTLLVLSESAILLNLLTLEGKGLQHTFLLPIRGTDLLLGKNLAYGIWFVPLNLIVLQFVNQLCGMPMSPPAAGVQALASFAAACALGNLVSVFLPFALSTSARRAMQTQAADSPGAARVFARITMLMALALICAPIFLATTPPWPVSGLNSALCALATLVYALALYSAALWVSGRAILRRQQALLKIVS